MRVASIEQHLLTTLHLGWDCGHQILPVHCLDESVVYYQEQLQQMGISIRSSALYLKPFISLSVQVNTCLLILSASHSCCSLVRSHQPQTKHQELRDDLFLYNKVLNLHLVMYHSPTFSCTEDDPTAGQVLLACRMLWPTSCHVISKHLLLLPQEYSMETLATHVSKPNCTTPVGIRHA